MTYSPKLPRRHFLARMLGAIAGGAWFGGLLPRRAETATTGQDDIPYLGEIRMFAPSFAPVGWAICDGRLLDPAQYDQLFALIGTTYGGDGELTFALPDLRGRAPVHAWTTPLGLAHGAESISLVSGQCPVHAHALQGSSALGASDDPAGRVPARNALGSPHYSANAGVSLASTALIPTGGSQPHDNMMPSLCINFIICIENGVIPNP